MIEGLLGNSVAMLLFNERELSWTSLKVFTSVEPSFSFIVEGSEETGSGIEIS